MTRRFICCALLAALLSAFGYSAKAQGDGRFMSYHPSSLSSCGAYTRAPAAERSWAQAWLWGFVSGVNQARSERGPRLADTDTDGIVSWVDKFCAENPLNTFTNAAITLVTELEKRGRP